MPSKIESEDAEIEESSENESKESSVAVPEDFQKNAETLVDSCSNIHQMSFVRDCLSKRERELMREESKKSKKSGSRPSEFTSTGMPVD